MKLLYLHHRDILEDTANSIQVLQMCNAFSEAGFDTSLLFPSNYSLEFVKDELHKKNDTNMSFEIIIYNSSTAFNLGKSFISCYKIIKFTKKISSNYQLFFTRHYLINHFLLKARLNSIHEIHAINFTSFKLLNYFIRKLITKDSKNNQQRLVIAISKKMKEYFLKRGIANDKIIVLHDGFSKDEFKEQLDIVEAKNRLGFQINKKVVSYVGSLYKNRGIEVIIELAKDNPGVQFLAIGGPIDQKEYYQLLATKNDVTNILFPGRIPHHNVKEYLFASDVLLMIWSWKVPTIEYCSPLKVFEYMAVGRIIVGQNFPTIPEVLTDGETALLANPDSIQELKLKMKTALRMEYPSCMASNARQKAFQNYTWENRVNTIKKSIQFFF